MSKHLSRILGSILLVVAVFSTGLVIAATTASDLMPLFTAEQATLLMSKFGSAIGHALVPDTDDTYDLGSASVEWQDAYFDGTVTTDALVNSGTSTLSGVVTATAGVKLGSDAIGTVGATGSTGGNGGAIVSGKFLTAVTGSDETKVVTLPACAAANVGELYFLQNLVSNKFLKVCPNSGGAINGGSADACVAMAATTVGYGTTTCICTAANTWSCA